MQLSYWEIKHWLTNIDFTIVGSGIVGLNCALKLRASYPKSKILVVEKGILPSGASTKNAGFACFGSVSEILDDLQHASEKDVLQLVKNRWQGLQELRALLGDTIINYKHYGGYEIFFKDDSDFFNQCYEKLPYLNELLTPIFKKDVFNIKKDTFHFKNTLQHHLFNQFEGQIDTGLMMKALIKKCVENDITILNNVAVHSYTDQLNNVTVYTDTFEFKTRKLFFATNGFAKKILNLKVLPARAQVLITSPIKNLKIKGAFHFHKGFYYFRNIDNRVLFGGGRNLDIQGETTEKFGRTRAIQQNLETLLKDNILPEASYEITDRWSGIMGVGDSKKPIVKAISNTVFCGVRLGGMGVAIGTLTGQQLADLAD